VKLVKSQQIIDGPTAREFDVSMAFWGGFGTYVCCTSAKLNLWAAENLAEPGPVADIIVFNPPRTQVALCIAIGLRGSA
jgi:hypothetical protein